MTGRQTMRGRSGRRVVAALVAVMALSAGSGVAYAFPDSAYPQRTVSQFARISPQPVVVETSVTPSLDGQSNPEGCPTGEHQQEVETALAAIGGFGPTVVDGQQSGPDCTAIKAFQSRFGILPANGRAGSVTADVARRMAASIASEELARCAAAGAEITVCVDLTQQTVWAVRDGAVVFGPTVTRTGMAGHATPTGTYHVYDRSVRGWSKPYKVWLPYWQNFNAGIGFHETTTYLHDKWNGSHGCVNLLRTDAVALWNITAGGTTVQVFGRRPGT
jgi:lipoprotein-anchoring transpeptidase ErfK/SrfK